MGTITNAGQAPIRWTLRRAASEFGVSIPTLVARLNEADETGAEDKTFSTQQITTALFGDVHRERLGKLKAEREQVELENLSFKREMLPREDLMRVMTEVANARLTVIKASKLRREEQDDLRRILSKIPIKIKALAETERPAQSANGNGSKPSRRSLSPAQEREDAPEPKRKVKAKAKTKPATG